MVFSIFCTGGLAVKLSILLVISVFRSLTSVVILLPISLTVCVWVSMDVCISSTFSVTADVMVVPILYRSSAVAQLSCDSLISVHVPVIVLRSSAMFWRIFSEKFSGFSFMFFSF